MTLYDDERAAYMRGDTERAELLLRLADLQARCDELEEQADERREKDYYEGYVEGFADARAEFMRERDDA